jgi:hypothetical protein
MLHIVQGRHRFRLPIIEAWRKLFESIKGLKNSGAEYILEPCHTTLTG